MYEGRNSSSSEFQKVMESAGGANLSRFFRQWLYQGGWPEYHISWRWSKPDGTVEISIRQTQTTGLFDMPVDLAFTAGKGKSVHRVRISEAEQTFRIPSASKPENVEIDPGNWVLKSISTDP
jgi:aminopeptidase N